MRTYLSFATTLIICVIGCLGARLTDMTSNYDNSTKALQLYCQFDMEDYDTLFSVKWRKDDHEFLSYAPLQLPTMEEFPLLGVHVNRNMTQCSQTSCTVYLNNLSPHLSSGEYNCEVTSDYNLTLISRVSQALNVTIDEPKADPKLLLLDPPRPYISNLTLLDIQRSSENMMRLYCEYDMVGQDLYSVKWFKDMKEFLRYVPGEIPSFQLEEVKGVHVDRMKTHCSNGSCVLFLQRQPMSLSAGEYVCEVMSDAPFFTTNHKKVTVPSTAPVNMKLPPD